MPPRERVEVCPHCDTSSQFATHPYPLRGAEHEGRMTMIPDTVVVIHVCRHCQGIVIDLAVPIRDPSELKSPRASTTRVEQVHGRGMFVERIHPSKPRPPKLSDDIPHDLRDAYEEAWCLQGMSEHAAAVMARRCLQLALRKKGFIKKTLHAEIEAAEKMVSSDLSQQLHFVREVGNIGAHPMDAEGGLDFEKLIDVQPGELEALFSAIREAFDEFYIRPARKQRDLDALNAKLTAAGKKPLAAKP